MRLSHLKIFTVFLLLLLPSAAFAYRTARIATDEAEVKDAPNGNAQATLPKGSRVNTSDQPTDGYYRIRSATGSGWVQEGDLEFFSSGTRAAPPKAERMEDPRGENSEQAEQAYHGPESPHPWALKVFGGIDFFNPTAVSNVIGSTALETGLGFGGEVDYGLSKSIYLAFRIEDLSKSATGPDSLGNTFQFNISSIPVMVGLMFNLANGSDFSLDLGLYGGEALSTSVSGTETNASAPNITTASASAPTFLADFDVNWHITEPFWIFAEVGYRYLNTSQVTPSAGSNGQAIFQSGGAFVPFNINLSGPVLNLGLRLSF